MGHHERPEDLEWSPPNVQYSLPLYQSHLVVLPVKSALSLTLQGVAGHDMFERKNKKKNKTYDQRVSGPAVGSAPLEPVLRL